ncbi:MAG: hypothetical protein C4520_14960 [Candidatus Abyssobacteria bacterium SURF_5]|uniref:Uncharacterized protein n=1 Tax=Abyssobacteria bacterium (strain SURF_5) TaxID=2093360 RepID=A0A3A4N9B7_ABYX5|nr:MAG: hypothetical protein C4520_14960 [Candidatus Abyssubacteria bacterium SURF_5]
MLRGQAPFYAGRRGLYDEKRAATWDHPYGSGVREERKSPVVPLFQRRNASVDLVMDSRRFKGSGWAGIIAGPNEFGPTGGGHDLGVEIRKFEKT